MTMKAQDTLEILKETYQCGFIRALDYHFSLFLYSLHPDPVLALAGALTSHNTASGNTCLDLREYALPEKAEGKSQKQKTLFGLPAIDHGKLLDSVSLPVSRWIAHLNTCPAVSDGSSPSPLVTHGQRVYLQRHWLHETFILTWLKKQKSCLQIDQAVCKKWLDRLFPGEEKNEINWQKMAVALSTLTTFSIISGGPGTGKTTTVIRLLALLIAISSGKKNRLTIKLAAPTGKAAARLSESIGKACKLLDCPDDMKALIPQQASTLHRLLGAFSGARHFRHNSENPLHLDILVVDEASMVDQTLMSRLLKALPAQARLILLGDKDQLASVEAGSVLGSLCEFSDMSYTPLMKNTLQTITGQTLPKNNRPEEHSGDKTTKSASSDRFFPGNHICLLKKSYRFHEKSGIARLAIAVNSGNWKQVEKLCSESFADFALHSTGDNDALSDMIIRGYTPFIQAVRENQPETSVHEAFSQFRVLGALREGSLGISGLNQMVCNSAAIRKLMVNTGSLWYRGRPVMISRNDQSLSLSNGDIGITMEDSDNKLRVAFILPDGRTVKIIPARLPAHETAFAMTVHKSQGSEFNHVVLVLPDHISPLLTRELLYTGITRARQRLDIFSSMEVIRQAVKQSTQRTSGLVERLEHECLTG